ncbi:MAG: hypothetical protein V1761_03020, partial [bacterium]
MAKMIDRVLQEWRLRRLNRRRDQKTFLESYLPLRIQTIEERRDRRIGRITQRSESILGPFAIQAGVATPALAKRHDDGIARIEERYRWQEKALAQSKKKALMKKTGDAAITALFDRKLTALYTEKAARIAALAVAHAPQSKDADAAKHHYEIKAATVNSAAEASVAMLQQKAERAIATLKTSFQTRIKQLEDHIETLRHQLLEQQTDARSADRNLPDGVILGLRNLSMR